MENSQIIKRPVSILIAAMGGEGGGVLMNWIVSAAVSEGLPVQATSIPGVAQRTGATTYYIEIWPEKLSRDDNKRPIFALSPAVGEVDIMIATELAEAARSLHNGYITPDRTTLLSSTHRVYLTLEKMAMGDGRLNEKKLFVSLQANAKQAIMFNALELANQHGTIINAVLLGALSGIKVSPLGEKTLRNAIEKEGKAVETNLAGFTAGLNAIQSTHKIAKDLHSTQIKTANSVTRNLENFPESTHEIINHGIERLTDYQDKKYSMTYLERLLVFSKNDTDLCKNIARHLAVRMSYEDITRVAQAKIRGKRFKRIRQELNAGPDDIYAVTEFFKPGIQEIADILPLRLGKISLWLASNLKLSEKLKWGMEVKTTSVLGFLKIWLLAKMKWSRPFSMRWNVEQDNINSWLVLIEAASKVNTQLAFEVSEMSRLIKGYGDTYLRGSRNYQKILELLVKPIISKITVTEKDIENIKKAREAALADPSGKSLKDALSESIGESVPLAAE